MTQVLVDGKNFQTAIEDYNAAQRLSEQGVNKVQVPPLSHPPLNSGIRAALSSSLFELSHPSLRRCLQARLLAGRGLAYEGLGDWEAAVADYDRALETARASDLKPDPYVLNSRANALGSLGRWSGA